jgi:hypothetical protein
MPKTLPQRTIPRCALLLWRLPADRQIQDGVVQWRPPPLVVSWCTLGSRSQLHTHELLRGIPASGELEASHQIWMASI